MDVPTLSASIAGYSSGSCSLGKSLLFSHFDNESILCYDALRSISLIYSHLYEARSRWSAADPNLTTIFFIIYNII